MKTNKSDNIKERGITKEATYKEACAFARGFDTAREQTAQEMKEEIRWIIQDMISNGHRQVMFRNEEVTAFEPKKEKYQKLCYCCNLLRRTEQRINEFLEKRYLATLSAESVGGKREGKK